MRLQREVRHVEVPNSLILSNSSTRDLDDLNIKKNPENVSPETLSHRLEKGWQHLQECPDTLLNNNNHSLDFNDNGSFHDDKVASSVTAPYIDGDYRAISSEDESSSDDDSSASYSDTSPLLDVSSFGNSDASIDSDMSEDSSSSSSSSSAEEDSMLDDCNNLNNNNGEEEDEEDMVSMDVPSMQSSWMSFSSSASTPSVTAGSSRGQIILPDVLPVEKISRSEEGGTNLLDDTSATSVVSTRNVEITIEKRRSSQDAGGSRMPGDRCLVEITTQPDVQVDIRVNPMASRPYRESKPMSIKHGNTYPRETKNSKRYLKNRNSNPWIVNDSFEDHSEDGSPKYWTLGEGIRLNNFTVMNGYKTLSLTEIVNSNTNEETDTVAMSNSKVQNSENIKRNSKPNNVLLNTYQNFERNYSKPPANVHMCCKDNWRFQRDTNNPVLKKNASTEVSTSNKCNPSLPETDIESYSSRVNTQKSRNAAKEMVADKPKQITSIRSAGTDDNSNKLTRSEKVPLKPKEVVRKEYYSSKAKLDGNKLSSSELFEVYTMETAVPHINWAAINKTSRESDWMKKRKNDREEIRRKLAMDSDTEDYVAEKLNQHRKSGSSFDHLKGSGNLQICFMNEAAKDQELLNPEDEEPIVNKSETPPPPIQKPAVQLPSGSPGKCDKNISLPANNMPISVTKRQRPKFFFNRPRSWHASKPEENHTTEEDLLTRHVRLQAEAREALAQAKEMAKMQMELERQKKKKSPIADIVGLPFPDGKNLLTHHALISMNVAQLQVIVNDLHSQIETLNEDLVKFLLERDDLHMEQDSMLVDIEDLTRYLGLKGSGCASSSGSQGSVNYAGTSNSKKFPQKESVRRSQSVHLKSKNLM